MLKASQRERQTEREREEVSIIFTEFLEVSVYVQKKNHCQPGSSPL
jgi:hypothetical protein